MFHLLDLLVLCAYFAVILTIGLAQRRKSGSVAGFALGDREMVWWAVLASILAAEISAATFLGAPEAGYSRRNWSYAQFAIGTILARVIVSFLFIPLFYKHGVISLYEYLETRFGKKTRKMASATFLVTRVLAMGTRLYVSAIILVLAYAMWQGGPVSPQTKFWLFAGGVVMVTLLTAVYTSVGGIRAVIWTDFIQVSVLLCALGFTVPFLLLHIPGGWDAAASVIRHPAFFDFATPDEPGLGAWLRTVFTEEYTIWAAFVGTTFVTMATHGIDQDTVQRMLTAKNRHQSAFATILSGLVDLPIVCSFILVGVLLRAYYEAHPTPGLPTETREVFPYFILHQMPPGMRGLVIAGILATAMGSLSTALNALATSFSRDFILPRLPADTPESARVNVLRRSTVLFAGLIIAVGIWTAWFMAHNPQFEILPLVLGILGFTFGSLLGVFLVAVLAPSRGSDTGNIIAMSCGMLAVVFLSDVLGVQKAVGFDRPGVSVLSLSAAHPDERILVETRDPRAGEAARLPQPARLPFLVLSFPWRVTLGTLVTAGVALCFPTPRKGKPASSRQDRPSGARGRPTG